MTTKQAMELKPCPFCGATATPKMYGIDPLLFKVECDKCSAGVRGFDQSQQDAIDAWNTRSAEAGEPVAYVPRSKAPRDMGEPVWRETFEAKWLNNGTWQGYDLMPLYAAPVVGAGVREALERAEIYFELIRLKLIDCLNEPERSAFWAAVKARDMVSAALADTVTETGGPAQAPGDAKLRLFLSILQSAGSETSGNDEKWNWINYFCGDAEPLDTFNQASKRKLIRVTHDSDSDDSHVYLTDAGRAFIAEGTALPSTDGNTP